MRLWIAAAAFLVLAVIGLATIPYVVEWEHYRSDIEAAIARETGHDIKIDGPIDLVLLPRPVLSAKDVIINGRADREIGFDLFAQQVDLGLRPGPLLAGRPIADQLKLTRPTLALDQAASEKIRTWPPALDDWSRLFFHPDLRLITINDGKLTLTRDDGDLGGQPLTAVHDLSLTIALTSTNGPVEAVGLFKTSQHQFTIAVDLGERSSAGSSSLKAEIGAQNGVDEITTLAFNGLVQDHVPNAALKGRIDIRGPDLRHGLKAVSAALGSPSAYLSLAPGQRFRIQGGITAGQSAIITDDLRITLEEKLGRGRIGLDIDPRPELDVELELPTIQLADETTLIDFVPLDLLSKFPTVPGLINLRMRELIYREKAIKRAALTIRTDERGRPRIERAKALFPGLVDVQFSGGIQSSGADRRLSGELTSGGDDLGETLRWLGLSPPDASRGFRGFSIDSKVDVSAVEISLSEIDMRLDSSKIAGEADLRFSERMRLGLNLDVERLDLDLYAGESDPGPLGRMLVQHMERLDTMIDARLERLSWRGLRFEDAVLSASSERQRFTLDQLALRTVGETEMTMTGDIDLQSDQVDLKAEVTSAFPTRVLRHVDIGLPLGSTRLRPLAFSGSIKGKLDDFDISLRTDYDNGLWQIKGKAGWPDQKAAHYDLTLEGAHPDHTALAGHFGLAPLLPVNDAPGPLQVQGLIRQTGDGPWVVSGSTQLGPTSITGRLERSAATEGAWEAKVSIGNPQRDSLAPFLAMIGIRSAGAWTPRSILGRLPKTPLRTRWLEGINGSITLSSRGGLAGDGFELSAKLQEGFFYVERLEGDLWNGRIMAELSLERRRDPAFPLLRRETR